MNDDSQIVERAIIMAAGVGKRMQPLTLKTPKPLIKVNGVRMIDSIVTALHQNEIYEIYVVIGYLKDQFYEWAKLQQSVKLLENPYYDTSNNISSLYVAREHLLNCIILDADQIINSPDVLARGFTKSGYNAVWCDNETKEWLMSVENGVVKSCSRNGGSHGWQLYSISRWTRNDALKLKKYVEYEFERGNKDIYWDDIAMFLHFDEFTLGIRKMSNNDVLEIDSLEELVAIDNSYLIRPEV